MKIENTAAYRRAVEVLKDPDRHHEGLGDYVFRLEDALQDLVDTIDYHARRDA